jgi:LPS export ABC transporter protein LptC
MKTLLLLAGLTALIVMISSYVNRLDSEVGGSGVRHLYHQDHPEIRVRNLELVHTDSSGHHLYHIAADELRHYFKRSTEMDNIQLTMTPADAPAWYTQADHGWIDQQEKLLMLYGMVILRQDESADSPAIEAISRDMLIDYQNSLAFSMAPATVLNGGHLLSGRGVEMHLKRPVQVRILADVSGSHVLD